MNIGNHRGEEVRTLIVLLEQALGRRASVREALRPVADIEETFASIEAINALTGFRPSTSLSREFPSSWNIFGRGMESGGTPGDLRKNRREQD